MAGIRLDLRLVELGHAPSRARAQAMIREGHVFINGKAATKAGLTCTEEDVLEIKGEVCPYVSRGGLKLQKALQDFMIDPRGCVCTDSGASTGGFTDCLLQLGAKKVFAIDVGTDQLVDKIRNDERVVVMEQTNIRYVTPDMLGEAIDLSVVDVSFISLRLVLPAIYDLLREGGQAVCLIKPQFEAGKEHLNKKGVVKDSKIHHQVLNDFLEYSSAIGFSVRNMTFSPVTGPEGNIEFLAHIIKSKNATVLPDTRQIVTDAHNTLKG